MTLATPQFAFWIGRRRADRIAMATTPIRRPCKIYDIGNNRPEQLMHVVSLLEKEFGGTALKDTLPLQPGDCRGNLCGCCRP
jgi:hypothetical protein